MLQAAVDEIPLLRAQVNGVQAALGVAIDRADVGGCGRVDGVRETLLEGQRQQIHRAGLPVCSYIAEEPLGRIRGQDGAGAGVLLRERYFNRALLQQIATSTERYTSARRPCEWLRS